MNSLPLWLDLVLRDFAVPLLLTTDDDPKYQDSATVFTYTIAPLMFGGNLRRRDYEIQLRLELNPDGATVRELQVDVNFECGTTGRKIPLPGSLIEFNRQVLDAMRAFDTREEW